MQANKIVADAAPSLALQVNPALQVNNVRVAGLVHEYEVALGGETVQGKVATRLKNLGKTAQIPGFRPGKVPPNLLQKRYGLAVLGEVVEDSVNEAMAKIIHDKGLRPALTPKVAVSALPAALPVTQPVVFTLTVEVLPEIPALDFASIQLEKSVVAVSDADIDEALERIAKGNRTQVAMDDAYAAQTGDVVVLDFDGSIDGVRKDGMQGKDFALELGSNRFIPGFEDQLVGIKAGEERTLTVTFPTDYGAKEFAGKHAVFATEAKSVNQLQTPALDDALAKAVGLEDMAALKEIVAKQVGENFAGVSRTLLKQDLLDKLAETVTFAVPPSLLEAETQSLWKQIEAARAANDLDEEDKGKTEEQLKADYAKIAERRVRLGLLLSEVARIHKIELSREDMRKAIMQEAMRYRGQEKEVVDFFGKNAAAREQLVAPVLEEKVIDFLFSKVSVQEKQTTREALTKAAQQAV